MLKKMFCSTAICLGIVFSISQNCTAQEKTKEELKAEHEVLKAEMKLEVTKKRQKEIEKLEAEPPKTCGVSSIDEIAENSKKLLLETKSLNEQVPKLYTRTIGETIDGITDVTVKKPTLEELSSLAATITKQIKSVAESTASIASASNDIKSLPLIQVPKATKSLNYSKDVLGLTGPELQMNLKVINNLIATLSSSQNN
jgi:hypothetical protein